MNKIPWLKQKTERALMRKEMRLNKRKSQGDYYLDKKSLVMATNSLYRLQLRNNPTKAEIIVGDYLYERKIPFQFQRGFIVPFHRIADFYIEHLKIIIEVDGGYHKDITEKDKNKDMIWGRKGITTFRITNEEVFDGTFKRKLDAIPRSKKEWEKIKDSYPQ